MPLAKAQRDMMLEAEPALFFITDHYRNRGGILVRLAALDARNLKELVLARIGEIATKRKKAAKRTVTKAIKSK